MPQNPFWLAPLTSQKTAVEAILGANSANYPGIVVIYKLNVTASDGQNPPVSTFYGTYQECYDEIESWETTQTITLSVTWHRLEGTSFRYSYTGTSKMLTFTSAPPLGSSICVRQLIGTVAVQAELGSVGSDEIANNAIKKKHLNFVGDEYRRYDNSANSTVWPAEAGNLIVINQDGSVRLDLIDASFIRGFNASVRTNRLDLMAVPTLSVNMNNQKIINVQAGTSSTDAVNYGQISSIINTSLPSITNRIRYGEPPNGSGAAPDYYFNTNQTTASGGSRTSTGSNLNDSVAGTVPRLVEFDQTQPILDDSNCLAKLGFFPRSIRLILAGVFAKKQGAANVPNQQNLVVELSSTQYYYIFDKLILEECNGFETYDVVNESPVTITDAPGIKVRQYYFDEPIQIGKKNASSSNPGQVAIAYPDSGSWTWTYPKGSLYIEQGGSYRVWVIIRHMDSDVATRYKTMVFRNYSQVSGTVDGNNPGAIQILASRGGNPIAI
jgi:hypothetical protein